MLRRPWVVSALAMACAGGPPPSVQPSTPTVVPVVARAVELESPPRREVANRCLPEGPPNEIKPDARPAQTPRSTCVDHRRAERVLGPKLLKAYSKSHAQGTVEVSFGCDPLRASVTELVVERGYGHGGSLQVWQLSRANAQVSHFDVVAIQTDAGYGPRPPRDAKPTVRVARGRVPAQQLEQVLRTVRPLLTATVRELEPPPVEGTISLGSFFTSSGNFHNFLQLVDESDHAMRAQFTGYPGTDGQHRYLGLKLAMAELGPVLDAVAFEPQAADEALGAWFSERLADAWPRVQGQFQWWVRARLVTLGGNAKSPVVVPMIVDQLERGLLEAKLRPDAAENLLEEPLTALARVTGWDPRREGAGDAASLVEAAITAVRECRAGMAAPAAD